MENPWKTLSIKKVHDSPWICVEDHDVINPAGKKGKYSKVHFKNYAIGIIPLDEELNTWLIGQHRYPINQYTWEIPEGGGSLKETPLASAKRELLEEAGIKAKKWTKVLEMHLSNSATDEFAVIYVAQDLSFHEPEPDEDEALAIKKIPFEEVYQQVFDGKLTDSLTVAGVLKTKLLLGEELISVFVN